MAFKCALLLAFCDCRLAVTAIETWAPTLGIVALTMPAIRGAVRLRNRERGIGATRRLGR
jgi:hypothetical protein